LAVATGIGPADILAAPPRVVMAMEQLLEEQAEKADLEDRLQRLRDKTK
jgi:hypothetical protein